MGIDTVKLNGEGFQVFVKEGDTVIKGQLLAKMDLSFLHQKEMNTEISVVVSNSAQYASVRMIKTGNCKANEEVLEVSND